MRLAPALADVHVEADGGVVAVHLGMDADPDGVRVGRRAASVAPPQREGNDLLLQDRDRLEELVGLGVAARAAAPEVMRDDRLELPGRSCPAGAADLQLPEEAVDLLQPRRPARLEGLLRRLVPLSRRVVRIARLGLAARILHRPARPDGDVPDQRGGAEGGCGAGLALGKDGLVLVGIGRGRQPHRLLVDRRSTGRQPLLQSPLRSGKQRLHRTHPDRLLTQDSAEKNGNKATGYGLRSTARAAGMQLICATPARISSRIVGEPACIQRAGKGGAYRGDSSPCHTTR